MTITGRIWMVIGIVLAGLCLIRVLTVAAHASGDDQASPRGAPRHDDVEVYDSIEAKADDDADSRSGGEGGRSEIRLSRPDEAAARVADQGYDLVPGVEHLHAEQADNSILVPRKVGRKIAAEEQLPPSPVPARQEEQAPSASSPPPTPGALSASVMEPKPFTNADARSRESEAPAENIVASNAPPGKGNYGLRAEPGPDTRIDPPVPQSTARQGVQEVSLIVSDYGYFPNRIFVTQNVPVKLYLTTPSKVTMCFMLDAWGLKKGVLPGKVEEVAFVPEQPGDYRFYCPVKSIEGKITVREAPGPAQSARGLAAEAPVTAGRGNEPKNAPQLRSLIED